MKIQGAVFAIRPRSGRSWDVVVGVEGSCDEVQKLIGNGPVTIEVDDSRPLRMERDAAVKRAEAAERNLEEAREQLAAVRAAIKVD